jgi:hypothetical protein
MQFKGTIVITDPCYLDADRGQDLWEASEYGDNLSVFGCSQWICESTIYGDWSCTTFKGDSKEISKIVNEVISLEQELDELDENALGYDSAYEIISKKIYFLNRTLQEKFPKLGRFCADAGMVCVVYLDDVLKVNPTFKQWAQEHPWCVTIIPDFDGNIEYEVDDNTDAHIVGKGNIDFYTLQTGL